MTGNFPRESFQRRRPYEELEKVDVMWRVIGVNGVVWECVWYRSGACFEFRVQRADDGNDVIAVREFLEIDQNMQVCADQWLSVALSKGFVKLEE